MTTPTESRQGHLVQLTAGHRMMLAARVCAHALWVWKGLTGTRLPELVARIGPLGHGRQQVDPARLGRFVHRVMNLGPFRPRCLTMSLVLMRELRRQGTEAGLVLGLPLQAEDHRAHAWVEVDGEVVGPPPGKLDNVELTRYRVSPSGPSDGMTRDRESVR